MVPRFGNQAASFFERLSVDRRARFTPALDYLSEGFEITDFRETGARTWTALLKPLDQIREQFLLNKEYLTIGSFFEEDLQQRAIRAQIPDDVAYRVDPQVRFVLSPAANALDAASMFASDSRMSVVVIGPPIINTDGSLRHDAPGLAATLRTGLWRRDQFAETEPVSTPRDFFGRETYVNEIRGSLLSGTPVALFGLRKVGKSSLLRRVQGLIANSGEFLPGTSTLICNSAGVKTGGFAVALERIVEGFRTTLGEVAKRLGSQIKAANATRVTSVRKNPARQNDADALEAAFLKDIGDILAAARALARERDREAVRLVLFMDEVDELSPIGAAPGKWKEDFFLLFGTLQALKRGLDDPREFTYLVAGVNPAIVERGTLLDRANPLFAQTPTFLPFMSPDDARLLMQGIGARMGLEFSRRACDRIHELTGGHPHLLRQLGSEIHRQDPDRSAVASVSQRKAEIEFRKSRVRFMEFLNWALQYLKESAPGEYELLLDLAQRGPRAYEDDWKDHAFRELFAGHLEKYGVLKIQRGRPEISISLIRAVLREPVATTPDERIRVLKEAADRVEQIIRSRLSHDLSTAFPDDAPKQVAHAIPREAKGRASDRDALLRVAADRGLRAMLDHLSWDDYLQLLTAHYDKIAWGSQSIDRETTLERIREAVRLLHYARHNNRDGTEALLRDTPFQDLYRQVLDVYDLFSE